MTNLIATIIRLSILCLLIIPVTGFAQSESCKGSSALDIAGTPVTVEVAKNERSRRYGLMFRQSIGKNCGMLFVFENIATRTFTMQNTLIPLDIAFISEQGEITEVLTMQPGVKRYPSNVRSKYALEVNAGWFKKNQLGVGSVIKLKIKENTLPLSELIDG